MMPLPRQYVESDLMIAVRYLKKSFDNEPVVDEVSFSVRKGETFAIVGPNGAGKTTILRMIAGLIEPAGNNRGEGKNINGAPGKPPSSLEKSEI
jgi:ABC-2 type transport system ATP-binding protein